MSWILKLTAMMTYPTFDESDGEQDRYFLEVAAARKAPSSSWMSALTAIMTYPTDDDDVDIERGLPREKVVSLRKPISPALTWMSAFTEKFTYPMDDD